MMFLPHAEFLHRPQESCHLRMTVPLHTKLVAPFLLFHLHSILNSLIEVITMDFLHVHSVQIYEERYGMLCITAV